MFSPINNNQQNGNQGPRMLTCDEFFAGIPVGCMIFYVALVGFWLIDLFTGIGANYLVSNYQKTVAGFQLWRLLTSAFYSSSLLLVGFIILNFQTFLPSLVFCVLSKEIKKGSTFLIVDLIARNFKLQLALLLTQFILSFLETNFINFQSEAIGLWFNYMTIFCWLNPKQMKLCCFNIKFSRAFYPLVFGLILSLWNWQIRADLIIGIVLGLLQSTVFKNIGDLLQISHYQTFNTILSKLGLSSFKNFVPIRSSHMDQKLQFQQNQLLAQHDQIDNRSTKSTSHSEKNPDHFSNLKGVRLGDC